MEADVLGNGHVRIQRVALEDHGDITFAWRQHRDVGGADEHVATVDRFEPGEHSQRRRLPATRRPDEHEEFTVGDLQFQLVDGRMGRARIAPGGFREGHGRHYTLLLSSVIVSSLSLNNGSAATT